VLVSINQALLRDVWKGEIDKVDPERVIVGLPIVIEHTEADSHLWPRPNGKIEEILVCPSGRFRTPRALEFLVID
jgi:hypothetical protein